MEKKNTILLTVIAIATLLVAVVGATFAYFTASVTTNPSSPGGNTIETKTAALPSAVMTYGADVVGGNNVLPGYQAVKKVNIAGQCTIDDNDCTSVATRITVKETGLAALGGDVTWKLYKSTTEITCTAGEDHTAEGQYYNEYTCKNAGAENITATALTMQAAETEKDYDYYYPVTVTKNTNEDYYLVVSYANKPEAQLHQGLTFKVTLGFEAV